MKQLLILLGLGLTALTGAVADDQKPAMTEATLTEDAMVQMVNDWYRLTSEIHSEDDIPGIMALMHDEMAYIHLEYDANYDRALLIDGFKRSLKRANTRNGTDTITNLIAGKNMVVTNRDIGWEQKGADGSWTAQTATGLVTLFEFKDGKIWRIKEYWD